MNGELIQREVELSYSKMEKFFLIDLILIHHESIFVGLPKLPCKKQSSYRDNLDS